MRPQNSRAAKSHDGTAGISVIGKVIRGTHAGRLLYYLFGPGKANEHTDPHLFAGFSDPRELEPDRRRDGSRDLRRLTGLLAQPMAALAGLGYDKPVWHCAVRAAPGDRILSDLEWEQVAAGIMQRTGLAAEHDELGVRWVAVRHAADHVHIVATLARQDGGRPRVWNDFYRVREACQDAERRLGLHPTAPGDRTAARRPTRAESEQAARRGWDETPRVRLRREVSVAAAGARTEQEFFTRLDRIGVAVRKRLSTINPGEVTGYAVGLPQHTTKDGGIVWYGGGKLAADLTLPKLRHRWDRPRSPGRDRPGEARLTVPDRNAIYAHAASQAAFAAEQIRHCSATDPSHAADAAWAAADALHVAARVLRSRGLRRAADAFDRAARAPYGRIPMPTRDGARLRSAARLLALTIDDSGYPAAASVRLIAKLIALAEAVSELRAAQQHAAQAAAARRAAEQLNADLARARPSTACAARPNRSGRTRPVDAEDVISRDFPLRLRPGRQPPPGPGPAVSRPSYRRQPPRRAGPRP
jgi:hypothetical protein